MAFRATEYERFTGRRARRPVWWPVCTATLRRGWSSRWVRLLSFGALAVAFGFTALFYFAYQVMPNWPTLLRVLGEDEGMASGFPVQFYAGLLHVFVYPILLPLSLLFGHDLVARDLTSNALETYFSRPVSPAAYVLGRTLAYTGFLLLTTLGPMLWIWAFDAATGPQGRFGEIAFVPLALIQGLVPVALVLALFIQAVSSVTRSGVWTNLAVIVLFFFGFVAGQILYEESDRPEVVSVPAASGGRNEAEPAAAAATTPAQAPVPAEETADNGPEPTVPADAPPRIRPDRLPLALLVGAALALVGGDPTPLLLAAPTLLFSGDRQDGRPPAAASAAVGRRGPPAGAGRSADRRPAPASPEERIVVHHDPRLLAVSITEVIRGWCLGCLDRSYPEEVRRAQAGRRHRFRATEPRQVPVDLARNVLLGLGGLSLLLLFARLRRQGTVG
ncbi:MAG: hypothetical protein D6702_13095 [Planctomycetota bacterium]|nr:MAG: hypothetical protein D6702_13095 [Planctomycetota bacterium]